MENTKDLIFDVIYNEQTETLEFVRESKTRKRRKAKIFETIKNHKVISTLVAMTIVLMAIDIVMIYKFVQVFIAG